MHAVKRHFEKYDRTGNRNNFEFVELSANKSEDNIELLVLKSTIKINFDFISHQQPSLLKAIIE